jgi:hypothetical protein
LISRFRRSPGWDEKPREEPGASGDFLDRPEDHPAADSRNITYPGEAGINPDRDEAATYRPSREEPGSDIGEAERERAAGVLREFLAENDTNVERAVRKRDQAERLELQGIPSDSARNRAERAREEVVDGISRLRRSLVDSNETGAARALELEIKKLGLSVSPEEIRPSS